MAQWINVPGGPPINFERVISFEATGSDIVFQLEGNKTISRRFASAEDAQDFLEIIQGALLNPTSGSPSLSSIDPATVSNAELENPTVTGVNFQTSAVISLGGTPMSTTFISSTSLLVFYDGSLAPGGSPYDVDYADGAGGTATLPAAFTTTA